MKLYNVYSYEYEVKVYVRGALIETSEMPIPSSGIIVMPKYEKGELVKKENFTINIVARRKYGAHKRLNILLRIEEEKYYNEFDCDKYIIEVDLVQESVIDENLQLDY